MKIDIDFDYSKVKGSTELHNKFKNEFIVSISESFTDVIAIPYDVGFFRAWSNPDIPVRCGLEGVPDVIVFGNGFYFMFDMKTGSAVLQPNQKAFKAQIAKINKGREKVFKLTTIAQGLEIIKNEKKAY